MRKHEKSKEKGRVRIMKNRMRLAAAALALSMAGFGLTGCSGQAKETEAKTEAQISRQVRPEPEYPGKRGPGR